MCLDVSSDDFMKLSINDVSDLLLSDITEDKKSSSALLIGVDQDGNQFELSVKLRRLIRYK